MRPGYLLYRTVVARPLGQANLPMNQRETQRGIRSRIDTITLEDSADVARARLDPLLRRHRRADLRRHLHDHRSGDRGYVSVGFPLPACELHSHPAPPPPPRRRAHPDQPWRVRLFRAGPLPERPGRETGELTVLAVPGFAEQLDVYVEDGELRAEHAFRIFDLPFLVLAYRIRARPDRHRPAVRQTVDMSPRPADPPSDPASDLAVGAAADELYGLEPARFVAARDARAQSLKAAGNTGAAKAVKALKKPSAAAWALNLLVREDRVQVDALLALGGSCATRRRRWPVTTCGHSPVNATAWYGLSPAGRPTWLARQGIRSPRR